MKSLSRLSSSWAVAALCLLALVATPRLLAADDRDVFVQNRRLGRSVNIIGYDRELWRNPAQGRFQAKYFRLLKEAGFDSVRINLHAFRSMDGAPDYRIREPWLATLDWAVTNALSNHLALILDFHEFGAMGENPEGNHDRFLAFWRQIAPRFKDAPSDVFFEILNEPAKKLTPELWNQYAAEALKIIRTSNPTRTVIIGPAFWNGIAHLPDLVLPAEDRNLIVTVHYYLPMAFTHQGAGWTDYKDKLGVEWKGTPEERDAVKRDFQKAQDWAAREKRPVLLGEFGAYDKADMASRARYTDCVARTAESLGWSWAYWQFDSDFVLYDIPKDAWVEPILHALIPPPK